MPSAAQNTDILTRLPTPPAEDSTNMSFLSGFLGNKGAEKFVDQAVDKAAAAAKRKVKETITGKKQEDKPGGMGGLFPSEGEKKPKQKGSGLFGGLLSAEQGPADKGPAAQSSGGDPGFADALDDLANDFAAQK